MKYLIVRSAPIERYRDALQKVLNEAGDDADIAVITQSNSNAVLMDIHPVRLFNYNGRRLSVFSLGWQALKRLHKEKFDNVIILCTNHLGDGYEHIMFLLFCAGITKVELWHPNNKITKTEPARFLLQFLRWYAELGICAVIWCVLFVVSMCKKKNGIAQGIK